MAVVVTDAAVVDDSVAVAVIVSTASTVAAAGSVAAVDSVVVVVVAAAPTKSPFTQPFCLSCPLLSNEIFFLLTLILPFLFHFNPFDAETKKKKMMPGTKEVGWTFIEGTLKQTNHK